jgi:hypothetical protein
MFGESIDAIDAIIAALVNIGADLNYPWKDRLSLNWLTPNISAFLTYVSCRERSPHRRKTEREKPLSTCGRTQPPHQRSGKLPVLVLVPGMR